MEAERLAREKEEEAKKAREAKIKEEFSDATGQWAKDKQDMQGLDANQRLPNKPAAEAVTNKQGKDADNGQDDGSSPKGAAAKAAEIAAKEDAKEEVS